jgi:hypothetical protein
LHGFVVVVVVALDGTPSSASPSIVVVVVVIVIIRAVLVLVLARTPRSCIALHCCRYPCRSRSRSHSNTTLMHRPPLLSLSLSFSFSFSLEHHAHASPSIVVIIVLVLVLVLARTPRSCIALHCCHYRFHSRSHSNTMLMRRPSLLSLTRVLSLCCTESVIKSMTTAEALERLNAHQVPNAIVNHPRTKVLTDPQVRTLRPSTCVVNVKSGRDSLLNSFKHVSVVLYAACDSRNSLACC